jgi:hypothetical protein
MPPHAVRQSADFSQLFPNDWAVNRYAQMGNPIFPDNWPAATEGSRLHTLGQLTSTLLSVEPRGRPSAANLLDHLIRLQTTSDFSETSSGLTIIDDDFFELENPEVDGTPNTHGPPTIPSGLGSGLGDWRTKRGSPRFLCPR